MCILYVKSALQSIYRRYCRRDAIIIAKNKNLTENTIREIKASIAAGNKQCDIAKKYNVTEGRVSQIKKESLKNDKIFIKKVKERKEKADQKILDRINSDRTLEILNTYMRYMTSDKAIENSLKNGVNDFLRGFGIIADKVTKIKELKLKERELHSKEKLDKANEENIKLITSMMIDAETQTINPEEEIAEFTKND